MSSHLSRRSGRNSKTWWPRTQKRKPMLRRERNKKGMGTRGQGTEERMTPARFDEGALFTCLPGSDSWKINLWETGARRSADGDEMEKGAHTHTHTHTWYDTPNTLNIHNTHPLNINPHKHITVSPWQAGKPGFRNLFLLIPPKPVLIKANKTEWSEWGSVARQESDALSRAMGARDSVLLMSTNQRNVCWLSPCSSPLLLYPQVVVCQSRHVIQTRLLIHPSLRGYRIPSKINTL